jgi:hypothetical protein
MSRLSTIVRFAIVWILLCGVLAWVVLSSGILSNHDATLVLVSFAAGAVVARSVPPLWRWADRPRD